MNRHIHFSRYQILVLLRIPFSRHSSPSANADVFLLFAHNFACSFYYRRQGLSTFYCPAVALIRVAYARSFVPNSRVTGLIEQVILHVPFSMSFEYDSQLECLSGGRTGQICTLFHLGRPDLHQKFAT